MIPFLFPFSRGLLFFPLVALDKIYVVFFGRVSLPYSSTLLGLRLLPPVPHCCCSPCMAFAYILFCLWVHCFLGPLSFLHLFPLTCSSTLVLRTFPRILVSFLGFLAIFLLGRFFLSFLGFGLVWFLFTFFVTLSTLSSFTTGSSLWAELSRMVVSWGYSGLGHLRSLVFHPLPVLVDGSLLLLLLLWFGGLSSTSVRSFGVPHLLSLHGSFSLPVWAGFLSFRSLLSSLNFQVLSALSFSCFSDYILSLLCGSCLFSSVILVYTLRFTAGGGLLVSSPLLPLFAWIRHGRHRLLYLASLHLAPLVRCVHGVSIVPSPI